MGVNISSFKRASVAFVAGMLITVIMSWISVSTADFGAPSPHEPFKVDVSSIWHWRLPYGSDREIIELWQWDSLGVCAVGLEIGDEYPTSIYTSIIDESAGWPMRALRGQTWDGYDPKSHKEVSATPGMIVWRNPFVYLTKTRSVPILLPYSPIWKGFAVDTLLFAGMLFAFRTVYLIVVRAMRSKRNQCPQCGYPLHMKGRDGCPECGWNRAAPISSQTMPRVRIITSSHHRATIN